MSCWELSNRLYFPTVACLVLDSVLDEIDLLNGLDSHAAKSMTLRQSVHGCGSPHFVTILVLQHMQIVRAMTRITVCRYQDCGPEQSVGGLQERLPGKAWQ